MTTKEVTTRLENAEPDTRDECAQALLTHFIYDKFYEMSTVHVSDYFNKVNNWLGEQKDQNKIGQFFRHFQNHFESVAVEAWGKEYNRIQTQIASTTFYRIKPRGFTLPQIPTPDKIFGLSLAPLTLRSRPGNTMGFSSDAEASLSVSKAVRKLVAEITAHFVSGQLDLIANEQYPVEEELESSSEEDFNLKGVSGSKNTSKEKANSSSSGSLKFVKEEEVEVRIENEFDDEISEGSLGKEKEEEMEEEKKKIKKLIPYYDIVSHQLYRIGKSSNSEQMNATQIETLLADENVRFFHERFNRTFSKGKDTPPKLINLLNLYLHETHTLELLYEYITSCDPAECVMIIMAYNSMPLNLRAWGNVIASEKCLLGGNSMIAVMIPRAGNIRRAKNPPTFLPLAKPYPSIPYITVNELKAYQAVAMTGVVVTIPLLLDAAKKRGVPMTTTRASDILIMEQAMNGSHARAVAKGNPNAVVKGETKELSTSCSPQDIPLMIKKKYFFMPGASDIHTFEFEDEDDIKAKAESNESDTGGGSEGEVGSGGGSGINSDTMRRKGSEVEEEEEESAEEILKKRKGKGKEKEGSKRSKVVV